MLHESTKPRSHRSPKTSDFRSTLHNWLKKADIEYGARLGVTEKEAVELGDARKRIRVLEQENEILLRAAASVARELPPKWNHVPLPAPLSTHRKPVWRSPAPGKPPRDGNPVSGKVWASGGLMCTSSTQPRMTIGTIRRSGTGSSPMSSESRVSVPDRTGSRGCAAANGSRLCSPRNAA